jgi:hypothetical protein
VLKQIRGEYIAIVSKMYSAYLKAYLSGLEKMQLPGPGQVRRQGWLWPRPWFGAGPWLGRLGMRALAWEGSGSWLFVVPLMDAGYLAAGSSRRTDSSSRSSLTLLPRRYPARRLLTL